MTVTIRPDLERDLHEWLRAGPFRSADELVNAALQQFMANSLADVDETTASVRRGLADVAAGRTRPARQAIHNLFDGLWTSHESGTVDS